MRVLEDGFVIEEDSLIEGFLLLEINSFEGCYSLLEGGFRWFHMRVWSADRGWFCVRGALPVLCERVV